MNQTLTYHLTAELLASLEAEGHPIGTGKQLQVQELLHRLPKDADAETLRLALCPLLARNPQEQARVYEIFDECQKRVEAMMPTDSTAEPSEIATAEELAEKELKKWRWRIIIPAVVLVLAVVAGLYFYFREIHAPETPAIEKPIEQQADSTQNALNQQPETSNQQTLFQPKPYPYDHDLTKYAITPPPAWQGWLFAHWWWLRWALLIPFTLLLIAIWRYLEHKRRKLIAEREHKDQPPYFWNIRIEGGDEILNGDFFAYTLQVMRRRMGADTFALDLPRTIQATAERGGLPEFRFREHTQPVDYLLLIDRQSIQNHRARLFDTLYQAFREQEIEMARFFYDSDMRVCFNEEHPHGVGLQELQQRYGSARLLVVGTGAQLISPLSGKLALWTSLFAAWKQRALFSPKPLADWGRLERRLPEIFTVLPATLQGLSFWVEELEDGQDAHFEEWRTRVKDAPQLPIQPDANDPLPLLRLHYDTPMLQWIAACAVYPSLHWDLTLWLGRQVQGHISPPLEGSGEAIVDLDNLLHLFRLPWFVEGEIPAPARAALLNWLEHEHPALLLHLRAELALLLRNNPPPQASTAFDDYQMNIALNEWLSTTDAQQKKEVEQSLAQMLERGVEPDYTVVKFADRKPNLVDFILPDEWRKIIRHPQSAWKKIVPVTKQISRLLEVLLIFLFSLKLFFILVILMKKYDARWFSKTFPSNISPRKEKNLDIGILLSKNKWNRFRWFLAIWLVGTSGLFWPWEMKLYKCEREKVEYVLENKTLSLCLDLPEKRVIYLEWLIRDAIKAGNIKLADSLSAERGQVSVSKEDPDVRLLRLKEISSRGGDTTALSPSPVIDPNNPPPAPPSPYFMPYTFPAGAIMVLGSIYPEGNKNIGVALFNRGVALYQAGQKDSACYYFQSALNFDSSEVDFLRGVAWCNQTLSQQSSTSAFEVPSDRKSGLEMVYVKGSAFIMGNSNGQSDECPHQAEVGDFRIGKYEVTQADWKEIMGNTPSFKDDCPDCPVDDVSWDDVQLFLKKLNAQTGRQYRLPTEEEWEFAARGGVKSKGYKYAGSNNPDAVAWYGQKVSTANPVGSKQPNELGIYDMSGNVWEWCQNESLPYPNCQVDKCYGCRVLRGGSWYFGATNTSVSNRDRYYPSRRSIDYGFRIAENVAAPSKNNNVSSIQPDMVSIEGGTFTMGNSEGNSDEAPTRSVTVSDFHIGKYEVTFEEYDQFCEKTSRKKPKSQGSSRGKNPVVNVSWLDAVAYCNWLSQTNNLAPCYSISGKSVTCNWSANGYRLSTEAEWEYAARGSIARKNYIYAGSNNLGEVAWFTENANGKTHPIGQKKANELGIYDMSGNIWEWCWDWKGNYDSNSATDPQGPGRGGVRVFRGGSWADNPFYCRTTVRYSGTPDHQSYSVGFRVARDSR